MKSARVVEIDGDRLRAGAWRRTEGEAFLAPVAGGPVPQTTTVRRCLDDLAARGYRAVLTAALAPEEQEPFLACGFGVHERLHLLAHDLRHLADPPPATRVLRRARRRDRTTVLAIDHRAFPPFWQLDRRGLREALSATPVARFRVADVGSVAGYAVTGRSLDRGYLQRLAVDPDYQGTGLGQALVLEALWWLRRRDVSSVLVNTQEANTTALRLYERLGFERQPEGLAVLHRPIASATS